jgi:hypothetical protein
MICSPVSDTTAPTDPSTRRQPPDHGQIGVVDPYHAISHHQDDPEKIAKLAKINAYHVQMLADSVGQGRAARCNARR